MQPYFWDPAYDGAGLDLATPLGFEPLIASDPVALRSEVGLYKLESVDP